MRVLLGAFGDPGHAFPMLALGEALAARGHAVALQTWRRWQEPAEAAGMTFAAAPEYQVFPTREQPLKPYAAAVRAAIETRPVVRSFAPDVVVSDILTPAPGDEEPDASHRERREAPVDVWRRVVKRDPMRPGCDGDGLEQAIEPVHGSGVAVDVGAPARKIGLASDEQG